jgi:hypothetical protein
MFINWGEGDIPLATKEEGKSCLICIIRYHMSLKHLKLSHNVPRHKTKRPRRRVDLDVSESDFT